MASKNFAEGTVATPPSPATSGLSLTVQTGQGSWFSAGPAAVWPPDVDPTPANAEIVTVQSISGDVLTLSARAAESSVAKSIANGWQVAQGLTAATFDGLIARVAALEADAGAAAVGVAFALGGI